MGAAAKWSGQRNGARCGHGGLPEELERRSGAGKHEAPPASGIGPHKGETAEAGRKEKYMGKITRGAREAGLSDQVELFCREYVASGCGNAASAAVAAGFARKSAKVTASRLLTKANVQVRICSLQAPILAKLEITAERVLNEIARIAFARIDQVLTFGPAGVIPKDSTTLSENVLAAVGKARQTISADGGSITMDMHDKLGALDKLARTLGLYDDKVTLKSPWDKQLAEMSTDEIRKRIEVLRETRLRAEAEKGADND
jgi:phage terminase small subunit